MRTERTTRKWVRKKSSWLLLVPLICLLTTGWIVRRSENLAGVGFERARQQWRQQYFRAAIRGFRQVLIDYPETAYAPRALWEIASICYYNLDRVDEAAEAYRRIISDYPLDPLAADARLKLAEVHEREFGDLETAVLLWEEALENDLPEARRRQVRLQIADAMLQTGRLEEARARLDSLVVSGDEVSFQAGVRLGTILQIEKQHRRAVPVFRRVLQRASCKECRLQARLGLIESYEILDDLPAALREARQLDPGPDTGGLRDPLLLRLLARQRPSPSRLRNAD